MINKQEDSSLEVENLCLNIDKYLDELEKTLEDKKFKPTISNFDSVLLGQNLNKKTKHIDKSNNSASGSDKNPNTSGEEYLSSANSQTVMIKKSTNMNNRHSMDKPNFSTSQQNLTYTNYNNFNYETNFLNKKKQLENNLSDNEENFDSVQFTTPFEFSKNKKFNRHSNKRFNRNGQLPTVELRWRNLTYYAKKNSNISKDKENKNNRIVAGRRMILDRQNGELQGGELAGIIGPSGAGKSTLLECLAGRRTLNLTGNITISYSPDYLENNERLKVAFIAQHDKVIGVLTVKESLMFASRLKNYRRIKNNYYHPRLVKSIIKELGLEKCANIPASKVSGGQLKRLCFAMELISGPDILLLDEPTSGLDSSSAGSTIELLRKLTDLKQLNHGIAYKPPAIICSIHQPSARVLHIFHKIYVLSNDGRCVYNGSPHALLTHLAKFGLHCPQFHNPADFIVEIASGDYGLAPINLLAKNNRPLVNLTNSEDNKNHQFNEKLGHMQALSVESLSSDMSDYPSKRVISVKISKVLNKMKRQKFPLFLHFFLLLKRTYLTTSRDPKLTWFRILQALFIGTVMAFLYDYPIGKDGGCILDSVENNATNDDDLSGLNSKTQDNIAFIFFITLFTVMASMMPTVLTFPAEVAVLIQERNNGWYSCWTYYWTKIFADTPYQLVVTIIFCSIVYPSTGQPWIWWRFALFNLISVLVSMIAQSVGILFGTIYVRSVETAVFMAPLSMAPVFLISGFFAKISKLPIFLKPIAFISYVRYAFEAFLVAMYGFSRCEDVPSLVIDNSSATDNLLFSAMKNKTNRSNNLLSNLGYEENKRNKIYIPAPGSRTKYLFKILPNYASEFPKVWAGYYNPVAYVQMMEQQNQFNNKPVAFSVSTPSSSFADNYQDNFDQTYPYENMKNNTESLTDVNTSFPTGNYVLNHFSLKDDNLVENIIILTFILFLLRVAGYFLLVYKTNQKR